MYFRNILWTSLSLNAVLYIFSIIISLTYTLDDSDQQQTNLGIYWISSQTEVCSGSVKNSLEYVRITRNYLDVFIFMYITKYNKYWNDNYLAIISPVAFKILTITWFKFEKCKYYQRTLWICLPIIAWNVLSGRGNSESDFILGGCWSISFTRIIIAVVIMLEIKQLKPQNPNLTNTTW